MIKLDAIADEELAHRAQLGQVEWLGELFRRYERRMYGCAHRMVAPAEVEDAVQEIAERVMRGLPSYRGESAVGTWVYSVARHTCLDIRRRRRQATEQVDELDMAEQDHSDMPEDAFDLSIMACRTALAIRGLPQTQQDVLMLRLGAGSSTEATATRLGITKDAVKARLKRARATLRHTLAEAAACPLCGPGVYEIGPGGIG